MRKLNVNVKFLNYTLKFRGEKFFKESKKDFHSLLYKNSYLFSSKIKHNNLFKHVQRYFSEQHKLDPYLVLEVTRGAEFKQIKAAYFKLARLYHPDTNKNDERAEKKFLLIKEAYEYFDRKYNPQKYVNLRMPINKFDEEDTIEKTKESDLGKGDEKKYESIRQKNRRKYSESDENKSNYSFNYTYNERTNYFTGFEESKEIYMNQKIKLEQFKQSNIERFLFTKTPVPRSYRMIDRLDLKSVTLGKGKIFGADDYLGITLLTLFILGLFFSRKKEYKTYTFENMENINIYNALKPSEILKIYDDDQRSPIEQKLLNSKEHQEYRDKKLAESVQKRLSINVNTGIINDVPKTDLKKRFNKSIDDMKKTEI